jgi:hemerythrin-like metal-binding protein
MALIEWENYYSVGISIIDKQHQRLIIIINDLADAMRQGKGREITKQIINDLKNYTLEHFTTEENYFKEFDYPDTEEHIKEHHDFIDKVNMFQTDFEAGKIGLSVKIMHFLSDWLKQHILETDKKYSDFLISKGVE